MDWKDLTEGVLRWIHVVAGIAWIGHLYFFNWVNAQFAPTMDGETKKKVVPELMPRALFWFRHGAAYTWVTGLLLAGLVYYMSKTVLWSPSVLEADHWSAPTIVMVLVAWLGFLVYDNVFKGFKDQRVAAAVGLVLVGAYLAGCEYWAHWSYRGQAIHVGILFGTTMAFNVWFRIWPYQKQIIAAVKAGTPPDAALVAAAGMRSKHNTYMSVPLVFAMLNQHETWAATKQPWTFLAVIALAWGLTMHLYAISKKVKGF
jgi:uncharacterized membrane protein